MVTEFEHGEKKYHHCYRRIRLECRGVKKTWRALNNEKKIHVRVTLKHSQASPTCSLLKCSIILDREEKIYGPDG